MAELASTIKDTSAETQPATPSGQLPHEARHVLIRLLRHGVILAKHSANHFQNVCRYQQPLRQHLADMYLRLVLDEAAGVAFIASVDELADDNDTGTDTDNDTVNLNDLPSLLTRRTLSLYDTIVLLVLRKHYQERETAGEQRIIIDIDRMESYLCPFMPLINSYKLARQKLLATLQKLVEKRVLTAVRGSEARFEITPVIRYVVNADFLETMLADYQQLAEKHNIELSAEPNSNDRPSYDEHNTS